MPGPTTTGPATTVSLATSPCWGAGFTFMRRAEPYPAAAVPSSCRSPRSTRAYCSAQQDGVGDLRAPTGQPRGRPSRWWAGTGAGSAATAPGVGSPGSRARAAHGPGPAGREAGGDLSRAGAARAGSCRCQPQPVPTPRPTQNLPGARRAIELLLGGALLFARAHLQRGLFLAGWPAPRVVEAQRRQRAHPHRGGAGLQHDHVGQIALAVGRGQPAGVAAGPRSRTAAPGR